MYEKKTEKMLSQKDFILRLLWHVLAAGVLILVVLIIGASGHMYFENLSMHDAFLNTALIVGGIGTTMIPASTTGKLFFALFGLFVGLIFAAVVGVVLAPIIHRIVHRMHLDDE